MYIILVSTFVLSVGVDLVSFIGGLPCDDNSEQISGIMLVSETCRCHELVCFVFFGADSSLICIVCLLHYASRFSGC